MFHKGTKVAAAPELPKAKRRISEEGLKRIIAATKKRWAAKRVAATQQEPVAAKEAAVKNAAVKTAPAKAAKKVAAKKAAKEIAFGHCSTHRGGGISTDAGSRGAVGFVQGGTRDGNQFTESRALRALRVTK